MQAKPFKSRKKIQTGTLRAVRREQSTLYRAWVHGEVTSEELRAGSLALARMRAVDEGQLIDERLDTIEAKLAARPNGGAGRPEIRP